MKSILAPVFLLVALAATACFGGSSVEVGQPVDLVPSTANFIAQVQVARLLEEADLASLYNDAPKDEDSPQTFEELLNKAQAEAGVDLREMSEAVMFGDVTRDEEFMGAIARGRFDQDKLAAAIQKESGAAPVFVEYKGFPVYLDQSADDETAWTLLNEETLAVGKREAVHGVIDVQVGDMAPLSGAVRDAYDNLGDALFLMAVAVPPDVTQDLGEEGMGDFPIALDALQDLTVVGFLADKNQDDMRFLANLGFNSDGSAAQVKSALDGLVGLMGAFSSDPNLATLLSKLEISVAGNVMSINFEAQLPELKSLMDSLGSEF